MIDTYTALGGSDMNWLSSVLIALIMIFVIWVVCVSYVQLTRSEITTFSLFMIFVRVAVLVAVTGGVSGWMGA